MPQSRPENTAFAIHHFRHRPFEFNREKNTRVEYMCRSRELRGLPKGGLYAQSSLPKHSMPRDLKVSKEVFVPVPMISTLSHLGARKLTHRDPSVHSVLFPQDIYRIGWHHQHQP
jgi:hypothetical protein